MVRVFIEERKELYILDRFRIRIMQTLHFILPYLLFTLTFLQIHPEVILIRLHYQEPILMLFEFREFLNFRFSLEKQGFS